MRAAEERQQMQPEQLQSAIRALLDQVDADRMQLDLLDIVSNSPRAASNDMAPEAPPAALRGRGAGARRKQSGK